MNVLPRFLYVDVLVLLVFTTVTSDGFVLRQSSQRSTPNSLSAAAFSSSPTSSCWIEAVLRDHGYGNRISTVSQSQLPLLCELYERGATVIGKIVEIIIEQKSDDSSTADGHPQQPPKVRVMIASEDNNMNEANNKGLISRTVDFGQITTIWPASEQLLSATTIATQTEPSSSLPPRRVDRAWDALYRARVATQRRGGKSLTKSSIPKILAEHGDCDFSNVERATHVLRQVLKTGPHSCRLVDSKVAMDCLSSSPSSSPGANDDSNRMRNSSKKKMASPSRSQVAQWLAQDAQSVGRFKRWPCMWLSATPGASTTMDNGCTISFLNGGWLVQDQSVRATTEGIQFVQRQTNTNSDHNSRSNDEQQRVVSADSRILHRLECLAMGEKLRDYYDVQADVRQVLNQLDIPTSPKGAKQALMQMGYWTRDITNSKSIEPWSADVLQAAKLYAEQLQDRTPATQEDPSPRVDLTHLPTVCIDAKGTSFSDDALGLRPRRSTDRPVDPKVSQWELLIHITDMTDLYSSTSKRSKSFLHTLYQAARARGTSRYDLPLGPLHLLPPTVLRSRSLSGGNALKIHECVTVWAYINEGTGQICDSGVERTLIRNPTQLSYQVASDLLENPPSQQSSNGKLAVLLVALERSVGKWNAQFLERNQGAQRRQSRIDSRNKIDPHNEFSRSRSHVLVDASLMLYTSVVSTLLKRQKSPIPMAAASERLSTAPLRRYIDGQAQRQAVAVLCGHGKPMSVAECKRAGRTATEARNAIANFRASKTMTTARARR